MTQRPRDRLRRRKTLKVLKPWQMQGMSERTWFRRQAERRTVHQLDAPKPTAVKPKTYWTPGDVVLRCPTPTCHGTNLVQNRLSFSCRDCDAKFRLAIERRQDRVCLMWYWV
jgi:hypothetical protein